MTRAARGRIARAGMPGGKDGVMKKKMERYLGKTADEWADTLEGIGRLGRFYWDGARHVFVGTEGELSDRGRSVMISKGTDSFREVYSLDGGGTVEFSYGCSSPDGSDDFGKGRMEFLRSKGVLGRNPTLVSETLPESIFGGYLWMTFRAGGWGDAE